MKRLLSGFWKWIRASKVIVPRRIHLGIDYGTSTSKLVYRDYHAAGGERAYPVIWKGKSRISSSVAVSDSELIFGFSPEDADGPRDAYQWHESVKMRIAGEAVSDIEHYYLGSTEGLPVGLSPKDLGALTLWFLISVADRVIHEHLGSHGAPTKLGGTMGIPMSFFSTPNLQKAFLNIARVGWKIFRTHGPLKSETLNVVTARELVQKAHEALEIDGPVKRDDIRLWIRSEAEAALWWPFRSPEVNADFPYAKVDIGAGTTNASMFRIVQRPMGPEMTWVNYGLAFFSAHSEPVGTDAIDKVLSISHGLPSEEHLSLRGKENEYMNEQSRQAIRETNERIGKPLRRTWFETYQKIKNSQNEVNQWSNFKLFTIGGGSLITRVREAITVHPANGPRIEQMELTRPGDFILPSGEPISKSDLPFLAVAYGLSNVGGGIPMVLTPEDVEPIPGSNTVLERLDREDIYAK